jgi:hypothetical protein
MAIENKILTRSTAESSIVSATENRTIKYRSLMSNRRFNPPNKVDLPQLRFPVKIYLELGSLSSIACSNSTKFLGQKPRPLALAEDGFIFLI